ncbi:hypothetical protein ABZU32_21740 [Sphaerisporangium sp. NPDC005288]|uniref:hypothetical protein n=1 Tax=Sphaerisporangium sp. NPDC005288 TaxID=3155114 RepID=UPI0033ABB105
MGYPGDRQPRRQPYQPYETPRQPGDLRPETEPQEEAGGPASWTATPEPDPDPPSWARADERRPHPYGDPSGASGASGDPTFGVGRTYGTPRTSAFPEQPGHVRPFETPRAGDGATYGHTAAGSTFGDTGEGPAPGNTGAGPAFRNTGAGSAFGSTGEGSAFGSTGEGSAFGNTGAGAGAASGRPAYGETRGDTGGDGAYGRTRAYGAEGPGGSFGGTQSGPAYGDTQGSRSSGEPRGGSFDPRGGSPETRAGSFEPRGASFEPRESGPLSGRQARPRPFEDLGRRPFEPPAPAQNDPFTRAPSQTGPFSATPSQPTSSFENTRAQTGAFESPRAQTGSFESRRAQTGSFDRTRAQAEPSEAGSAGAVPPPPKEARRSEPDLVPRTSRAPLFMIGGVLALVAVIVVGIAIMSGSDQPTGTAAPSPSGATAQAPVVGRVGGGKYGFAASRKSDPQPLTLGEVFGRKKVTTHGRSYLMTVRRLDKKCKDAVHGTKMQKVLTAGKCTQFLRASFRDAHGKLIGTVGVANLNTAAGAKKAAKTGTGGELEDYVSPLQGKDSATKLLGSGGESYATAWPQGHYLVLLWFQYKDGHKPSKDELKRLNRAAMDITETTVFSALDTRALTGARSN